MQARMKNPVMVVPDAMPALLALAKAVSASARASGVPVSTLNLVYLRASQINGCSVCVDMHARDARYFTDAERAALALAESVTRLSDRADPVADEIWDAATRHYDEQALAALITAISTVNLWNRLNASTRQVARKWAA
jgi:AhpD family alkylhydroperoxidase